MATVSSILALTVALAATVSGGSGVTVAQTATVNAERQVDTLDIYGERQDTLQQTVITASGQSNFLSKNKEIRTEVITAAGLCKMACCNLAESFENSASVTVGYSDAVTGARQIRLLGQSGVYTQMLDENRPVMRGLSAPWGLTFIPSQWLESIQIAKGVTSVINGVESMTGQINMEHRKPTDEKPFYLHASIMNDTKADLNMASSLQLDPQGRLSTVILAHVDGNFQTMDQNSDGFRDEPLSRNIGLSNRWLYQAPGGMQIRAGVRAIADSRVGGQMEDAWRANVDNRSANAYLKVGQPLGEDQARSIALVADYTIQSIGSDYGFAQENLLLPHRIYNATQGSGFFNLLYQDNTDEHHHYTVGISDTYDVYDEDILIGTSKALRVPLNVLGAFGEYTFKQGDVFTAIAGLRAEAYSGSGLKISPRLTLKWAPIEELVVRFNGGRGLRYANLIVDNIGIMSTGKSLTGSYENHPLEDSWTLGGNATWYFTPKTYLSLDYFHSSFTEQLILDNRASEINICMLSAMDGGYSYTSNWQLDFSSEPVKGLTLTLTGRYTDARQTRPGSTSDIKPMTSRYKAVFNTQYATNLNKWIFDFTAALNGPMKLWEFMDTDYSPCYPSLYAQVTKRFKGLDIYMGGENLTGFRQENPIINAANPSADTFDASCIWGPLMGARFYAGIRLTIWKTEKL